MKKILGLVVLQICSMQADDGFYVRAMSASTDGTYDPGEGFVYPNTIGFQTHPVSLPKSSHKRRLDEARNENLAMVEKQPVKKRGKLSTWMNSSKQPSAVAKPAADKNKKNKI